MTSVLQICFCFAITSRQHNLGQSDQSYFKTYHWRAQLNNSTLATFTKIHASFIGDEKCISWQRGNNYGEWRYQCRTGWQLENDGLFSADSLHLSLNHFICMVSQTLGLDLECFKLISQVTRLHHTAKHLQPKMNLHAFTIHYWYAIYDPVNFVAFIVLIFCISWDNQQFFSTLLDPLNHLQNWSPSVLLMIFITSYESVPRITFIISRL